MVALWKHPELATAFIAFVQQISKQESDLATSSSPGFSITTSILNEISLLFSSLLELKPSSDISAYIQFLLQLCVAIAHSVLHTPIHTMIYKILNYGLGSSRPYLVVLPCLVDITLEDDEEHAKELSQILTGLLMKFDLQNVSLFVCMNA